MAIGNKYIFGILSNQSLARPFLEIVAFFLEMVDSLLDHVQMARINHHLACVKA